MQQSQQNPSSGGGLESLFLYAGLTMLLFIVLWMMFHDPWSRFILKMNSIFIFIPAKIFPAAARVEEIIPRMAARLSEITFRDMLTLTNKVLIYYLPVGLYFPARGAYLSLFKDKVAKMTLSHDAESLLSRLNQLYPYTAPILRRNLNFDDSPDFAWADLPHEYAKKQGIVKKGKFDTERCREVLRGQLGKKFAPLGLAPYEKALYAIFAARINRDMQGAQVVLDELSRSILSSQAGVVDYSLADELFKKHWKAGKPFSTIHAYTRTVLCSMFEAAKLRGKISSSMFLWLKPVDRTLWYALNRVGAPVPYPEAMGVWNHWKAEQAAFTGKKEIDWQEFLEIDDETGKPRWCKMVPMFQLKEIWVENAIHGFQDDLGHTGIIMLPDSSPPGATHQQSEQGGMQFENLGAGSSAMRMRQQSTRNKTVRGKRYENQD